MTTYPLQITEDEPGYWSARADIMEAGESVRYLVTGNSLAEIRELVAEGIAGGLEQPGIGFVEHFVDSDSWN